MVDVPKDYVRISSTLGDAMPCNILAAPFVYEDKLVGVVEFSALVEMLKMAPDEVKREFATLRDMEKARGGMRDGKTVLCLW